MRAAVLTDVRRIEIRDVPAVRPGPRDVVVRMRAVGLCGTDFHIYEGHGNYHTGADGRPIPLRDHPQVLGHELMGVVEEAGPDARGVAAGDRVIVDQGRSCASAGRPPCEYCATGDSHQCAEYQEHGITGLQGGLAEYLTIPAANAVPVSAGLPDVEAALAEPLGCIVHASDAVARAGGRYRLDAAEAGRRVRAILIFGGGPAGLLFVQYLRAALGFDGQILVAEPNPLKRSLAGRFGATAVDPAAVDLGEAVRDLTSGRRVEYAIDAAGAGGVFLQVPGVLRKQGTFLLYGHGHAGVDLSALNAVQFLEPTFVSPCGASGAFDGEGRPATYRRALGLIERGTVAVAPFVTHRYTSLDEVPDAFAGAHRADDYVKGVVTLGNS